MAIKTRENIEGINVNQMKRERTYDRIYYNKELIFSRETSYWIEESRNFYCVSPLDLTMALIEVMKDMSDQIRDLQDE